MGCAWAGAWAPASSCARHLANLYAKLSVSSRAAQIAGHLHAMTRPQLIADAINGFFA